MKKFHAIGLYEAIAIGTASVFEHQNSGVRRKKIRDTEKELKRVKKAKEQALSQLSEIYEKAVSDVGKTHADIFEIHMMMIEDDDYNDSIERIIRTQSVNAEYAVSVTSDKFLEMFASMRDEYMQARARDVKDISNRIIACLTNENQQKSETSERIIICADDLSPSEVICLNSDKVLAFVTAFGSSNSHTAILARGMNMPAIVNAGADFLKSVSSGNRIIADGHTGNIIIEPDSKTEMFYIKRQAEDNRKKELWQKLKGKENVTKDGKKINIYANMGGLKEMGEVLANDADGIGLFRSEFLYLKNDGFPTEEMQFSVYKKILKSMPGKKVIIRSLDIGADKGADYFNLDKEENPALGCRAIRICLARPEIFKTQLRALYRASVYGNLGIMFPMITSVVEVEKIKAILEEVKSELTKEKIAYSDNIETGIMIETPAAALISDELAPLVDFFSVGTNDLTQYTLACDRQNAELEQFKDTHHKAVLRLIGISAQNAHKSGTRIGICGELAADTSLTETFLRMGIDELSVPASFVLPLREAVRNTDLRK